MPAGITDKQYARAEKSIEKAFNNYMPVTESGCWIWLGATTQGGYGMTKVLGKTQLMHRLSFARANGYMPYGEIICHKCDVPSCMNPNHLFPGTQKDNVNDMIEKGRASWQR